MSKALAAFKAFFENNFLFPHALIKASAILCLSFLQMTPARFFSI